MATAAEINTKVNEAVTAIEAGNWSTALSKLLAAQALLAGKADSRTLTLNTELRWDRNAIDRLILQVRQQQGAGKGIQRTDLTHVNPGT